MFKTILTASLLMSIGSAYASTGDFPSCKNTEMNGIDWNQTSVEVRTALTDCHQKMLNKFSEALQQVVTDNLKITTWNYSAPMSCTDGVAIPFAATTQEFDFNYAGTLQVTTAGSSALLSLGQSIYWTVSSQDHDISFGEVRDDLGNIVKPGIPATQTDRTVSERLYFRLTNAATGALVMDTGELSNELIMRLGTPGEVKDWLLAFSCDRALPPVIVPKR